MKKYNADLVIIGGGTAGLYLAYLASKKGIGTVVIRKGQGATALSSGNIDIMGYYYGQDGWFDSGAEGISFVNKVSKTHPYALLDKVVEPVKKDFEHDFECGRNAITSVDDSIHTFIELTGDTYTGSITKNAYIGTTLGTIKPTGYLPFYMKEGDLSKHKDSKIVIVGIYGYPDFNASFCANNLRYLSPRLLFPVESIESVVVKFRPIEEVSNLDVFGIAKRLDSEENRSLFIDDLKDVLKSKEYTHIAFPPILGLENTNKIISELEEELNAKVFEFAAPPPTTQGLRLLNILEREGNINIQRGEVIGVNKENKTVKSVVVKDYSSKFLVEGKIFGLATGKFISDGIIDHNGLRETIFGLPVFDGETWVKRLDPIKMSNKQLITNEGHRFLRIGIRVDHMMRPLNQELEYPLENVVAAGSVIGGYNPSFEMNGFGVSISTAYRAAKTIDILLEG